MQVQFLPSPPLRRSLVQIQVSLVFPPGHGAGWQRVARRNSGHRGYDALTGGFGVVAQLAEHLAGSQKAKGSNPFYSTGLTLLGDSPRLAPYVAPTVHFPL
jgi:hypothetical protein